VRESSFGRRFTAGRSPHLHPGDLDPAACTDCHALAMPVQQDEGQLQIR